MTESQWTAYERARETWLAAGKLARLDAWIIGACRTFGAVVRRYTR